MEKILISACFLGKKVRYDGNANTLTNEIIQKWRNENRLISVCPEVSGGLSTPRAAAEIQPDTISVQKKIPTITLSEKHELTNKKKILTKEGENVTNAFYRGARNALELCLKHEIRFALLKESSPSCGSINIYDGSFTKIKIAGEGITAEMLRANKIEVFSENNLELLISKLST